MGFSPSLLNAGPVGFVTSVGSETRRLRFDYGRATVGDGHPNW
jgi:hypothetical protein